MQVDVSPYFVNNLILKYRVDLMQSLSNLLTNINDDWLPYLLPESKKTYFQSLERQIQQSPTGVFPPEKQIFRVFQDCSLAQVKVVILGQDPYPTKGHANGLSFSVNRGVEIPKSLKNIFKELHDDLACPLPSHGDLSSWLDQGVLLLNASLTVNEGNAGSHSAWGWNLFIDRVIQVLNEEKTGLVFILWGNDARAQKNNISAKHHIIESSHPSPLGAYRSFWGSKPFSRCNAHLKAENKKEIDWCIK